MVLITPKRFKSAKRLASQRGSIPPHPTKQNISGENRQGASRLLFFYGGTMFKFSRNSLKRMKGVEPELQLVMKEALKVSPIDFGIPPDGGVRTADRQNEMFLDPLIATDCDGYKNKSNHQVPEGEQYGRAIDFYAYLNGRASWNKAHLAVIAGVVLSTATRLKEEGRISIELRWGATFDSNSFEGWDYPHIEVTR
jgi:peptidoglycan L-alanyl-D-glutamate endopeptidase CwlK